jgi:hypothetical protein
MLASSVTTMPSTNDTMTVLVANTVPLFGRSSPRTAKAELRPLAKTRPRKRPATDASAPITMPSSSTERSTCRREAPRVRSVANSRARCATVIDRVLKMTKAPTKRAIPPNARRKS